MTIAEMHVWFRQYAQQMGMQNACRAHRVRHGTEYGVEFNAHLQSKYDF